VRIWPLFLYRNWGIGESLYKILALWKTSFLERIRSKELGSTHTVPSP
jgi:hypothetical protein